MIRRLSIGFFFVVVITACLQGQETVHLEEHLQERVASLSEEEGLADGGQDWERLMRLRRRLDLNRIDPVEMGDLLGLTPLQVQAFESYRRLVGPMVDGLELQAVPGWDEATVRRVLPWVYVAAHPSLPTLLHNQWQAGVHTILCQSSLQSSHLQEQKEAVQRGQPFLGSPVRLLLRYGFVYDRKIRWGITLEKDPGEPLLAQKPAAGFDMLAAHVAWKGSGVIRTLVLGDFQVNLGQGLVMWQGMAYRKTSDAMLIMRQGEVFRPHTGTDELRFQRGFALEVGRGRWQLAMFASTRGLDAHRVTDTGSGQPAYVSSLLTTGLHRTPRELQQRQALGLSGIGGRLTYHHRRGRIAFNGWGGRYSLPWRKEPSMYNLFAMSGLHFSNMSAEVGYSLHNMYLFGEVAVNGCGGVAYIQGAMASLHPRLDLAWLHRRISPRYHTLYGNAFTEGAEPTNEVGSYLGISLRLPLGCKVDAWLDAFRFPWLRYQVDRPSRGQSALLQVSWLPDKRTDIFLRWMRESKGQHAVGVSGPMREVLAFTRSAMRFQYSHRPGPAWLVRVRVEGTTVRAGQMPEHGFASHLDLQYRPISCRWRWMARLAYYETGGYSSRIYGFENDVPYRNVQSVYHGRGFRCYGIAEWRGGRQISCAAKWGITLRGKTQGMDIRVQMLLVLGSEGGAVARRF